MDFFDNISTQTIIVGVLVLVLFYYLFMQPEGFANSYPPEYTNAPRAVAHFLTQNYDAAQADTIFYRRFGRHISPEDLSGPLTRNEKRNFNKMRSNSRRDVLGLPIWE